MSMALLSYDEIDKEKWDQCIQNSPNGLIYATTVYLDAMCPSWKGIVRNDYEAVMPLPWKRKFGIEYLYQPAFIQQGGIFSPAKITGEITKDFLEVAYKRYRYSNTTLNYLNVGLADFFNRQLRNNFVVYLNKTSQDFFVRHPYFAKRCRRAEKNELTYDFETDYAKIIDIYRDLYGKRLPAFCADDYNSFKTICRYFNQFGSLMIRTVMWDPLESTCRHASLSIL